MTSFKVHQFLQIIFLISLIDVIYSKTASFKMSLNDEYDSFQSLTENNKKKSPSVGSFTDSYDFLDQREKYGQTHIFIITLTGRNITLPVERTAKVDVIKSKILESEGVPFDEQKLIYDGRILKDGFKFSDYNIVKDSCVYLLLNLKENQTNLNETYNLMDEIDATNTTEVFGEDSDDLNENSETDYEDDEENSENENELNSSENQIDDSEHISEQENTLTSNQKSSLPQTKSIYNTEDDNILS